MLEEIGGRKLVLDAGGGEGQTAIKTGTRPSVTLCDLSGEMIARARQAAEAKGVSKERIYTMPGSGRRFAFGKPG